MKNNLEYIHELCHSLLSQGKRPSVALIRSHANRPLSIPDVVKGLQGWKKNPQTSDNIEVSESKEVAKTQATLAERVQQLELQVAEMSAQLSALSQRKDP